jgi:hypothetical protein
MSYGQMVQRAAKLVLEITWADGPVTRVTGENLMVHLTAAQAQPVFTFAGLEDPDLRGWMPPGPSRRIVLEITLDLGGSLQTEAVAADERPQP